MSWRASSGPRNSRRMPKSALPRLFLDACILITFGNCRALELITRCTRFQGEVGGRVQAEVLRPPASNELRAALRAGALRSVELDLYDSREAGQLQRFEERPAFRGRGDAEVLALAVSRQGWVGSDDPAVRRAATGELGKNSVVGSLDLLVWAVRDGRLGMPESKKLISRLDVGPRINRSLAAAGVTMEDLVER